MLVIKILAVIASIAAFFFSIAMFNAHCEGKFGHAFFSP